MSKKDTILMLPALAIIVSIGAYLLAVNFLLPDIFTTQAKIQAYDVDIEKAQAKLTSISESTDSILKLSSTVNAILLAVPDSVDAPNLITEVESMAAVNGLALPNISPPTVSSSAEPDNDLTGLTTTLTVMGSFQNVSNFINALETSIRYSKIKSVTMNVSEDGLNTTITFEVYKRPAVSSSISDIEE